VISRVRVSSPVEGIDWIEGTNFTITGGFITVICHPDGVETEINPRTGKPIAVHPVDVQHMAPPTTTDRRSWAGRLRRSA
jgi:hypothetical protein